MLLCNTSATEQVMGCCIPSAHYGIQDLWILYSIVKLLGGKFSKTNLHASLSSAVLTLLMESQQGRLQIVTM